VTALAVLFALTVAEAAPCTPIGVVRAVSEPRDVRVLHEGDPLWRMVKVNDPLCPSDRLRTWLGASAEVYLNDGISGTLDADSDVVVRACGVTQYRGTVSYGVPDGVACPFAIDLGDSEAYIAGLHSTVLVEREMVQGCDPAVRIAVADTTGALVNGRSIHRATVHGPDGVVLGEVEGGQAVEVGSGLVLLPEGRGDGRRMLARVRGDELRRAGVRPVPTDDLLGAEGTIIWIVSEHKPTRMWIDGDNVPAALDQIESDMWELTLPTAAQHVRAILPSGVELRGELRADDVWLLLARNLVARLPRGATIPDGLRTPSFGANDDADQTAVGIRLGEVAIPLPKSQPLTLATLSGGTFAMGSPETVGDPDEHPQHPVTVSAFSIGLTEVTQAQWRSVVEAGQDARPAIAEAEALDPSPSTSEGATRPVDNVSWCDVVRWLNVLSVLRDRAGEAVAPVYEISSACEAGGAATLRPGVHGYRLPTEAEWEYAARAGCSADFCDSEGQRAELSEVGWYARNTKETQPVGGKSANPWGLHDMIGNVWEWTGDWWDKHYYRSAPPANPVGPPPTQTRVIRGASVVNAPSWCRYANRGGMAPAYEAAQLGFRVAVTAAPIPE
jgi:formylglycine-generating enzyme required for sulfatase activity